MPSSSIAKILFAKADRWTQLHWSRIPSLEQIESISGKHSTAKSYNFVSNIQIPFGKKHKTLHHQPSFYIKKILQSSLKNSNVIFFEIHRASVLEEKLVEKLFLFQLFFRLDCQMGQKKDFLFHQFTQLVLLNCLPVSS